MTDKEENVAYDWYDTFASLIRQANERGKGETKFSACEHCIAEELEDFFDGKDMIAQGKAMGIEVIFVSCDKHAGATI